MESRVTVTFSLPSLAKTVKAAFSIRGNIKFWSWPVSSRYLLYDRRAGQLVYTYSPAEASSWGDNIINQYFCVCVCSYRGDIRQQNKQKQTNI